MSLVELPYEISIPAFTPKLRDVLRPRLQKSVIHWAKGGGEHAEEKEVIATFDIRWGPRELDRVDPDLLERVRTGAIIMPWPGTIRSAGAGNGALLTFSPQVHRDWLAKGPEDAITAVMGWVRASKVLRFTSQTVWMILELDHGGGDNAWINAELDAMDAGVSVVRT